jgi:microcystin-dependent protein
MATFYLGQIIQGGWNFAPRGSAMCSGQLLAIQQNTALFSLLGTNFGGNGTTNFGLPDLQGRTMVHQGQGSGLSNYVLGQSGGAEQGTLTVANLPAHTHSGALSATTTKATLQLAAAGSVLGHSVDGATNPTSLPQIYCPSGTTPNVALAGLNVAATGNNVPFSILQPYLAVTFVILLEGVFPSRN